MIDAGCTRLRRPALGHTRSHTDGGRMDDEPEKPDQRGVAIGIGMSLGLAMGAAIGLLLGNLAIGLALGIAVGVAVGIGFPSLGKR